MEFSPFERILDLFLKCLLLVSSPIETLCMSVINVTAWLLIISIGMISGYIYWFCGVLESSWIWFTLFVKFNGNFCKFSLDFVGEVLLLVFSIGDEDYFPRISRSLLPSWLWSASQGVSSIWRMYEPFFLRDSYCKS